MTVICAGEGLAPCNAATMLLCDKLISFPLRGLARHKFILYSLHVSGGTQPAQVAANHRNYTRTTTLPSLAPVNSDANAACA